MELHTYHEELLFRVYAPGSPHEHRALIPSELDLALLNIQLAKHQEELDRLQELELPGEIAALEDAWNEAGQLPAADRDRVTRYRTEQATAREFWRNGHWRLRRRLQEALQLLEQPETDGVPVERVTFVLREFSYRERMRLEAEYSKLNPATGQRDVDVAARNAALLDLCAQYQVVGEQRRDLKAPSETLPAKVAQTLIDRMWARAEMSPEVAQYFRQRG